MALGSWGLSLENGAGDPTQALGTAVALAAHGTGAAFGGLVNQVTALRLVTPDGTVVRCSDTEEPEIFAAARAGLGALGVISTVTVRCLPGFNLRVRTEAIHRDRALADFDRLADGNDHVELSWRPGRTHARVTTANRTPDAADGRDVDRGYRWFNRRPTARHLVEYSVARAEAGPALRRAAATAAPARRTVPFPIVVTVSAGDDIPLSPAQGRPSVYIAGLAGLDGRPQWGTVHGQGCEELRRRYPRIGEWEAVRDRLDPQRRFAYSSGQG
jgi:L-gulonolactone oxidase